MSKQIHLLPCPNLHSIHLLISWLLVVVAVTAANSYMLNFQPNGGSMHQPFLSPLLSSMGATYPITPRFFASSFVTDSRTSYPRIYPPSMMNNFLQMYSPYVVNSQWNLLPFSSGVYCDQKVITDTKYQQCRLDASVEWQNKPSDSYTNPSSSSSMATQQMTYDNKQSCCFFWYVLYCTEKAVKRLCDSQALNYFRMRRDDMRANLEAETGYCYDYTYNGYYCVWQYYVILFGIILAVLFVLAVVATVIWLIMSRRRAMANDSDSDIDDDRRVRGNTRRLKMFGSGAANHSPPHHHHHSSGSVLADNNNNNSSSSSYRKESEIPTPHRTPANNFATSTLDDDIGANYERHQRSKRVTSIRQVSY